jgi:NAD(P)-dependent dehydrogenase (short-subunit alcohol dehydrogenase family)
VPEPTVLVTGAGRGIGRAVALAFLDAGWRAVAGVRDAAGYPEHERLLVVPLDVSDPAAVREAVARAEAFAGGALACVVNNAGYAVGGAQEDADLDAVREMFETNLFGAAAVTQAALPGMRGAARGTVVYLSSIGDRICNPLFGFYHASKYGMAALAEALAVEGRPFGIRVLLVEPGMVETDFPRNVRLTGALAGGDGPYAPLLDSVRAGMRGWRARYSVGADDVAREVVRAVGDPEAGFRLPVGDDAEMLGRERAEHDDAAWQDRLCRFLEVDWPRRA